MSILDKPKTVKVPGPDHPITIEHNPHRIVVTVAGRIVADTRDALTLREAAYPPVQYVPTTDVDMALLRRTDHATYCPYKGEYSYYRIPIGGERTINAVWTYDEPYAAVAAIRDHVAFYPDRVDLRIRSARFLFEIMEFANGAMSARSRSIPRPALPKCCAMSSSTMSAP